MENELMEKYENEPNELTAIDIKPRLAIQGQKLILEWTCPRCKFTNDTPLPLSNLLTYFNEIRCENIKICGDRSVWFDVNLRIDAGYQISLADVSLVERKE